MTPPWLVEDPISHRSFRLVDLLEGPAQIISSRTVTDSTIYGPAVAILINSVTMTHCVFEGEPEGLFWELQPERQFVIGAIGLVGCTFERCQFQGVGFAGTKEVLDVFRGAVQSSDPSPSFASPLEL